MTAPAVCCPTTGPRACVRIAQEKISAFEKLFSSQRATIGFVHA